MNWILQVVSSCPVYTKIIRNAIQANIKYKLLLPIQLQYTDWRMQMIHEKAINKKNGGFRQYYKEQDIQSYSEIIFYT